MKKLLLFGLCVLFAGAMVEIQAAGIALNSEDQLVAAISEIMTKINTFVQGLPGGENGLNEFQQKFLKRLNGQAGRRQSEVFLQEVADFLDVLMALAPQKTKDLNSIKSLKDKANALFVVQQEREQQARVAPSVEDVVQPPVAPMPPASVKKMPPPVAPKPASKLEPVALPVEPVRAASPVETAPIVAPEVDVAPVTDTAPQIIAPEQGEPQRVPTPAHSDDEFDFGDGTVSTLPAALAPIVISEEGDQDFNFDNGYPSALPAAVAPIVITGGYHEDFAFGDDSHPAVSSREPSPVVAPVPTVVAPREPSPVPVAAIAAAVAPLNQPTVIASARPWEDFRNQMEASQAKALDIVDPKAREAAGFMALSQIPGFTDLDPQQRELFNPADKKPLDKALALVATNLVTDLSYGAELSSSSSTKYYLGKHELNEQLVTRAFERTVDLLGAQHMLGMPAFAVKTVAAKRKWEEVIQAILSLDYLCSEEIDKQRKYHELLKKMSRENRDLRAIRDYIERQIMQGPRFEQQRLTLQNLDEWRRIMYEQFLKMGIEEVQRDLLLRVLHQLVQPEPAPTAREAALHAPTEFGLELLITHLELRLRLLEKLKLGGLVNLSPEDIVRLYFRPDFDPGWLHQEFQRVMRENNVQSHDVRRLTELVRNVRPGAGEEDIARLVKAIRSGLKDEAEARREILEEPTVPFFWEEFRRYAKAEPVLRDFDINSEALLASMIEHFRRKLPLVLDELQWQFANGELIEPNTMTKVLQKVLPEMSEHMARHLSKELLALQRPRYL